MSTAVISVPKEDALGPQFARAEAYIRYSRAGSTRRGYRADFADFVRFCEVFELRHLPAAAETVCTYVSQCADRGLKAGSIQRRASAIAAAHATAGFDSPTNHASVRLCLAGIRRAIGTRQQGKTPILTSDITAMLSHAPDGLLGLRDRALLLIGFAGALRRSELVGLDVEDLTFGDEGLTILIRRSKTDQDGAGQTIGIARGVKLCPLVALGNWLAGAGITSGPIFRSVNRHGQVQQKRLTDQVVALVVKRYAKAAGLNPMDFGGHSLRAGLVTSAAMNSVPEHVIQRQTRHKSADMLRRYIRDASLFRENASARVGL